eukprot:Clim_evm8s145 gene=Clim_evmTU8s145
MLLLRQTARTVTKHARVRYSASSANPEALKAMMKESKETSKIWKYASLAAVPGCFAYGVYLFATEEHHHSEHVAYPYLRIRSKIFPWGDEDLFNVFKRKLGIQSHHDDE